MSEDAALHFELVPLDPDLVGPFEFKNSPLLRIGRDPGSEIVLPYPSVSRRHARIQFESGRWLLLDAGSRHGTFLNGQQLDVEMPVEFSNGDRLSFPPHEYRVRLGGQSAIRRPSISKATMPVMPMRVPPSRSW